MDNKVKVEAKEKITKIEDSTEENNRKKNRFVKIFLFILFFCIFVFSLINLVRWAIYNNRSKNDIEKIKETVIINDFDKEDEAEAEEIVNFEALREINSDAVAWIRIPDTNINYPILQTDDNDYYLHRDINKKYSTCGWIFMDWQNVPSLIDKNTVLYGHNIKSGFMFADLLKIYKGKLGTDINIEIYTDTKKAVYEVFSSYQTEPEDYAIKSNIVSDTSMEQYLKTMVSRSTINYNIMPAKTDRVLTLSTCDNSGQNRVLVHAVLITEEEYQK